MPPFGSQRVFALFKEIEAIQAGLQISLQISVSWTTNVVIANLQVIIQPSDSLAQIANTIKAACVTKANQLSGQTFTTSQVFIPSYT